MLTHSPSAVILDVCGAGLYYSSDTEVIKSELDFPVSWYLAAQHQQVGGSVVQWLALSHSKKDLGSIPAQGPSVHTSPCV